MTATIKEHVEKTNTDLAEIGRKAAALWNSSERDSQRGDAMATFALFQAWHVSTFKAETRTKQGHLEKEISFDLRDYVEKPCKNADGSRDNKMTLARTLAVLEKVFGLNAEQVTNAHKTRLARCMTRVAYLASQGYDETHVKLSPRGFLQVPYPVMHEEPDAEKATEREIRDWNNNQGDFETLDGKEGMSLAALDRRAKPKEKRNTTDPIVEQSNTFVSSVAFLNKTLAAIMDDSGENKDADSIPSPNESLRKSMFELHALLSSYFDADPIKEEKKGQKVGDKKQAA
jgi:hypothetical protein